MGNACISGLRDSRVKPPTEGTILTSREVETIVRAAFNLPVSSSVFLSDRDYFAYSTDKLREFLRADLTNALVYKAEALDCDDFARVLTGREREWFSGHTMGAYGSTLGIVWGDLRASETDEVVSPHAMNFFIDSTRKLWLLEPQSDVLREPTSNSTYWMANV
jgi:hypothetical protein